MTEPSTRTLAAALDELRGVPPLQPAWNLRRQSARARRWPPPSPSRQSRPIATGCEQTGHPDPQAFFDAAHRGRRWRAAPTVLLGQLVLNGSPNAASYAEAMAEVCRAAQTLGVPNARTAGNAAVAAAAQLGALTQLRSRQQPGPRWSTCSVPST